MRILLTDGYFIEPDNYNLILKQAKERQKGKDKGEKYENVIGYYGNMAQTVKAYLKRVAIDEITATDIQGAADQVETILNKKAEEIAEYVSGIPRE